jgi:hypothetical protein
MSTGKFEIVTHGKKNAKNVTPCRLSSWYD